MGLPCSSDAICGPGGGTCDISTSQCYNSMIQIVNCPCTNINNGFCQSNDCYCYFGFGSGCNCDAGSYSKEILTKNNV